jgi:hypothetical protein
LFKKCSHCILGTCPNRQVVTIGNNFMKTVIYIGFLFLPFVSFSQKQCDYTADSLKVILNENLQEFIDSLSKESLIAKNNITSIPEVVRKAIDCWKNEFSMANPNEAFQTTDALPGGKKLPWRQLTYLGVSNHYLILTYKYGGTGLVNHILLFRFNNSRILDFWGGPCKELKNKKQVLAYLNSIKTKGNYGYFIQ